MSETAHRDRILTRAALVLAGASAAAEPCFPPEVLDAAEARGYLAPDEEEEIKLRYAQYLGVRTALLQVLAATEPASGRDSKEWALHLPAFAAAFGAACLLVRGSLSLIAQGERCRPLRKKLDEGDSLRGIPRKTFANIYRAASDPLRLNRFAAAADFYYEHRSSIAAMAEDPVFARLPALLAAEEAWLASVRPGIVRRHLRYRWFSFKRRHHSAWKQSVFGFFEWSGRAIADLRQPGLKPGGAPKRVSAALREETLALVRPGDIFVTRHDDALSNLFLPGHWPHAALYLGSPEQRAAHGVKLAPPLERRLTGGICFLEAKKDGVLLRLAEDTLEVDSFVVLRPPLDPGALAAALTRAMDHTDKPFDFSFDFRKADRLACTALVYRTYHRCGPLVFSLVEVSARPCLPAEELISQALAQDFAVVAACGIGNDAIVTGTDALLALHASRSAL
ncbi:YiiX/YebB-like N1pC/P60 family cysteine hydrolase [Luteolibacter sp. Populi]|uniref:YiiX/YebB-like N1pC/P60 family cysteine hydrolase n=1 Tax=Luteolibacter sp. Populi TaxID=3230487 RepID=UPI003466619B